ncbi:MAG: 2,3-bisphosphoglycerate-independent phosphoglycerate mutase [Deltaproteobacteria bacterium]|nr:2,3-bisphosphoglycerate-independent phosphoglycerate mutase [Deltaproteobacteria bacterium]
MTAKQRPVALIILDGWGHREEIQDNGIALANKPYMDSLFANYPHTLIDGSGPAVGLPEGIMGNSEVGHMNLGAGRVVFTGLSQIYKAIETKEFFTNPALLKAIDHVKSTNGVLHLQGLLSDGAVHSHQDHLYALLQLAKEKGVSQVLVHAFMDGRDTPPEDGVKYLQALEQKFNEIGLGRLASVSGRYYAMDRDQRWERIEKAFRVITGQSGTQSVDNAVDYLKQCYADQKGDEFIPPVMIGNKAHQVNQKDAMIFFNFRADRARQISHALTDATFEHFNRQSELPGVYVCMSPYDETLKCPVAFTPNYPDRVFGEIIAENNLKQLRIAETEKYAHVTFFFNGGRDRVFKNEDRCLVPSPKEVATYDLKPEMSAKLVTEELSKRLQQQTYDVIVCNYANPDMVGHTAIEPAVVEAIQTIDACLGTVVPEILKQGGAVIITADHGNAEQLVDDNGQPLTAHTTNLVPCLLVSDQHKQAKLRSGGRLCDVAPTLLKLLELEQPKEMTGLSLF